MVCSIKIHSMLCHRCYRFFTFLFHQKKSNAFDVVCNKYCMTLLRALSNRKYWRVCEMYLHAVFGMLLASPTTGSAYLFRLGFMLSFVKEKNSPRNQLQIVSPSNNFKIRKMHARDKHDGQTAQKNKQTLPKMKTTTKSNGRYRINFRAN